ncbi:MAG: tetratricopeptide repeat protein [Desulfobacteraceae bacterium]|nr:tetratricopeptide repeat protein [Desulfobacteraceae bacterium]
MKKTLAAIFILVCVLWMSFNTHAGEKLPIAVGIIVKKARMPAQNQKYEKAIEVLEAFRNKGTGVDKKRADKKGYNHYYLHFLLGNYYSLMVQKMPEHGEKILMRKALKNYEAAVKVYPGFSAAWLNLARCRYETQDFANAAMSFLKGYETAEAKKTSHLYYAAVCHLQASQNEKALSVFQTLLKAHPNEISLAWKETLVHILFSLDKYRQALPLLEELAKKNTGPKQKKWQEILLYQYLSLDMKPKALKLAKILTRTDPTEPKWWKALSHIHLAGDNHKKGLSALLIYGYLTPLTREEQLLAADLYLSLDIPLKAISFYETALKELHNDDQILRISNACSIAYQPEKALQWIEKGLDGKANPKLLQLKGQILYGFKSYEKAADTYEALAKQLKKPGEALLMLGYCAMNCSQFDRAQKAFTNACKYKKQKTSAQKALAQLKILRGNSKS